MSCRNNGVQEEELQDSSDEENPILPEIRVLSRLSGLPVRPRPSIANAPGTSGNPPPAPPPSSVASPARRQNRTERDRFFWTLMGNSSRTSPRYRNSAGPSRGARPSTVADLIASNNRLFQPARCPPYGCKRACGSPDGKQSLPPMDTCQHEGYNRYYVLPNSSKSVSQHEPAGEIEAHSIAAVNNDTPSTSGTRPTKSLRQVVKEITREHMRMITVERKVPSDESIRESIEYALRHSIQEHEARNANRNANASSGRPLMLVRTARPERSSDAPNGTNTSQLSEEDMEVRVGSPSTTDDYVETVIEVAEPINMTTGAISLEEEIVEIDTEPEAPAPTPANPPPAPEEIPGSSTSEPSEQSRAVKRKRESDTHESVSSLNQCLLGLLECPVCMEWMEPPITQCRRGHLVCGTCRKRLDTCPVCRTAFSSVRNRAMENVAGILRYPCRHGCGKEVRHARRARHEASCASRLYACPLPACEAAPPMPRVALPAHCQSRHPQQYRSGCSQRVSLRVNCEQHQQWVVAALAQLFHVRVDVDVRTWGVVVYVALLGPQKLAKNYTYEVTVSGRHNNRGLVYKRTTHSDLENSVLNTSRQDCFHLTLDQALNFLRYKNEHSETDKTLDFTINLAECEEPEESRELSDCGSPKE